MFLLGLGLNSKILVLLVFKDNLFALSHVVRSFKSWLMYLFIFFSKLVLSANGGFHGLIRLLMYIKKSSGSKTEPCGTPNSIKALSDVSPLTVTCCFLLVR